MDPQSVKELRQAHTRLRRAVEEAVAHCPRCGGAGSIRSTNHDGGEVVGECYECAPLRSALEDTNVA